METFADDLSTTSLLLDPMEGSTLEESIDALLNSPQISGSASDDATSPVGVIDGTPIPYMMNAVHMEVQENAKVPNSYNIPMRRPTEGRGRGLSIDRDGFLDDIMRFDEADWNLTENFLGSTDRMSAAAAYSNAGLLSSIGTKVESMNKKIESGEEVKGKNEVIKGIVKTNCASSSLEDFSPQTVSTVKKHEVGTQSNLLSNTYSYGRPVPLPIPSPPTPSPPCVPPVQIKNASDTKVKENTFVKAVSKASVTSPSLPMNAKNLRAPMVNQQYYPYYPYPQTNLNTYSTTVPFSSSTPPQPIVSPVPAPSPFLLDATRKRSQFGFPNHTVPSVPLPPTSKSPKRKTQSAKNKSQSRWTPWTKTKKSQSIALPNKASKRNIPASPTISSSSNANEGPSYERKKQRAKDARLKLNDSIERLSIAINVAGTQSKQRAHLHSYWGSRCSATTNSTSTRGGNYSTVKLMEDVGKASDMAKKWDRPSFVGTAATLVQGLNAQCEALMREVVQLRKERIQLKQEKHDSMTEKNAACHQCRKRRKRQGEGDESSNLVSCSSSYDEVDGRVGGGLSVERKLKTDQANENRSNIGMMALFKEGRLFCSIVSYLDPWSITQCMAVSTFWRCHLDCFTDDKIWCNLCARRFGTDKVREWQNTSWQNANIDGKDKNNRNIGKMKMIQVYRQMNIENVKPMCHFEGNLCLGIGKIYNAVSASVSIVERSNGETQRTVQATHGKYSSMPVVELRILIQNIGVAGEALFIPEQIISVDSSTKRRGDEMLEITSDERFSKRILRLDGSAVTFRRSNRQGQLRGGAESLFKIELFQSFILCVFIHAQACQTTTKFRQKAKFVKLLVSIRGTTLPLVISNSH